MQQPQRFAPQSIPPGHMARFAQPAFSVLFISHYFLQELCIQIGNRVSINTDRTTAQRPHSTTAQSVVCVCRRAVRVRRADIGYRSPLA